MHRGGRGFAGYQLRARPFARGGGHYSYAGGGGHVRERFPSPTAAEKQSASGAIDFAFRVLRICSIVIVYMHMDMEIIIVA